MTRLVLRLTTLAKYAALTAAIGGGFAVYGKLNAVGWAISLGTGMLFAGAIVYYIERFRMFKARRKAFYEQGKEEEGQ